jgi:predicted dienelactone hydrolase
LVRGLLGSLIVAFSCSIAHPSLAAERLKLRLGPFEQSIAIADLEDFAETGELSPTLRPYGVVLTPTLRKALAERLELDPNFGDQVVNDLLSSPAGKRMLMALGVAIPGSTVEQLQAAITLAARQANGLSVLAVLKAFPEETITVDLTSAAAIASQVNFSYWATQTLNPILEKELEVKAAPFQAPFDPAAPGPQTVQRRTLVLRDTTRDRTIPVDLYWSDRTSGPLVVISSGFGANRTFLGYLARHLASYGLTVASMEHPGSNMTWLAQPTTEALPDTLLSAAEFVERPQDISFMLDRLARLDRQPGALQGKLNTNQVSVIGHSLGGYTALALAGAELNLDGLRAFCQERIPLGLSPADWLQCTAVDLKEKQINLRDSRIAQAIALNPVIGRLFGPAGLAKVAVPTLILSSTDDSLTPALSHQLQPFSQLPQPKYLLTAIGATHLSVGDPTNFSQLITQSTLVKERHGADTDNLRQLLKGATLAFIEQLTPAAERYRPFLTPSYAQSLSTTALPLRLNTTLPAKLTPWLQVAAIPSHQLNAQVGQRVSASAYYFVACNSVLYTVSTTFGNSSWQLWSQRGRRLRDRIS